MSNLSDNTETEHETHPLVVSICIGIVITSIIFLAVIGNILTIIAFFRDQKLRNVYNTYILNLAITDFLLGCVSMAFYAVYTLKTYIWPFGYDFCKVYLVIDFTLSLESVLIMVIISHDRLLLLKLGTLYTSAETPRRAYLKILISWLIALLLYSPAIIGWDLWTGKNIVAQYDCDVQFANNYIFTTVTAVFEFVIPLFLLTGINVCVYLNIKKRSRFFESKNISAHKEHEKHKTPTCNHIELENRCIIATQSCSNSAPGNSTTTRDDNATILTKSIRRREIRAAKCLSVLVVVFVITWAPYTITTVLISFCSSCVNEDAYEFLTWLLWLKAAINPFLYAFNSARFRRNFKEILCCLSRSMRHNKVVDLMNEETISTIHRYRRSTNSDNSG